MDGLAKKLYLVFLYYSVELSLLALPYTETLKT